MLINNVVNVTPRTPQHQVSVPKKQNGVETDVVDGTKTPTKLLIKSDVVTLDASRNPDGGTIRRIMLMNSVVNVTPRTPQHRVSAPIEIPVPKKQNGVDRQTHISPNDPIRRRLDFVTEPIPENDGVHGATGPLTPIRQHSDEHDAATPGAPKKPNGGNIRRTDSNFNVFDAIPPPLVW
jgi:hypothetical protein